MDVYINGKRQRLRPDQAIAKGGEADIFKLNDQQVLKLFKPPDHPDYYGMPQEQQAAERRLTEHQRKLRQFPRSLPDRVVQPVELVTDRAGQQLLGYTMPFIDPATVLLKYGDRTGQQAGLRTERAIAAFRDLHHTLTQIHQVGVVIGDFNDMNVLLSESGTQPTAHLIDADSWQFDTFRCRVFTTRFVDPLLCDYSQGAPNLLQPHCAESDWYAFAVMLFRSLLFVDPYGGVYRPDRPAQKLPPATRPAQRITVFHPDVKYPKPARPLQVLEDRWLDYFRQVFEHDRREPFPRALLDALTWQQCSTCGLEHGKAICPTCQPRLLVPLGPVPATTLPTSKISAVQRFATSGQILTAAIHQGQIQWLYHHQGQLWREGDRLVLTGDPQPGMKFFIQGETTLIAQGENWIALTPGHPPERLAAEWVAVADDRRYWSHNGQLWRQGTLGPVYLGDVLSGQTQFWMGPRFGVGFYRADRLTVGFVCDRQRPGLNDRITLNLGSGLLLNAHCTFGERLAWLFTVTQHQGQIWYHCTVIHQSGTVLATAMDTATGDSWVARILNGTETSGLCALGQRLLAATDEGILPIDWVPGAGNGGTIASAPAIADTEPFVDSTSQLLATSSCIYVVQPHKIWQLTGISTPEN